MLSTVDIPPSVQEIDAQPYASVTKLREVSNGVTVSRLKCGNFAISVHDGNTRAIVDLTPEELRDFAVRLTVLAA